MRSFLESNEDQVRKLRRNFGFFGVAISLLCLVLCIRLFHLQIIQGKKFSQTSAENSLKQKAIIAPRGLIKDRNGRILVDNKLSHQVIINPQYVQNIDEIAKAVAPILLTTPEEILDKSKKSRRNLGKFVPVVLQRHLNQDQVLQLKRLRLFHPGLDIENVLVRNYPLMEGAAQLFGYVGEISKNQLKTRLKNNPATRLKAGDLVGIKGIEAQYDKTLRGIDGVKYVQVDAYGREQDVEENLTSLSTQTYPAIIGKNLELTLDLELQKTAHKSFYRADKVGKRQGALVALNATGEVLAWVSEPSFDPNGFVRGLSSDLWKKWSQDPLRPFRNKVIQDHYPPGSTFKPFVAMAGLNEGIFKPWTKVNSPSFLFFGGRKFHDHSKYGHGKVNVVSALEKSANVFFYKAGIELGINKIAAYSKRLGLGAQTEIEIYNEVPGLIPTEEWKKEKLKTIWYPGETLSQAIGQGYVLVTPLQMATAYLAIGNNGIVYQPHIIKSIDGEKPIQAKKRHNNIIASNEISDLKLTQESLKTVQKGLYSVVHGDRGTGRGYRLYNGITMAGKTGTSQVRGFESKNIYKKCEERDLTSRHHGWFIAYAPAEKPEIVVAALAMHSCHGSSGAAPMVKDVILKYFEEKNKKPVGPTPKSFPKNKNLLKNLGPQNSEENIPQLLQPLQQGASL